ncbi:purine nucleoside phosphorylase-like [Poecilia latipinna]|uniref:purine nucleoside phosphorylase-like n=1 Tax=Poecilia latipinna TaxID=48699 RepID=UPI00072E3CA3|nr:PREDICTED: purine nucleoside phosphorylase-like [Poecilia latipinna]
MLSKGSSCCYSFDDYKLTTEWLQNQTRHRPKVAVICGSGLGLLAEAAAEKQTFRYQDIPNFPVSTVPGHEGCLVFGTIEETPCVFMKGHFHLYEGYSLCQVTFPVRIFKLLGVDSLLNQVLVFNTSSPLTIWTQMRETRPHQNRHRAGPFPLSEPPLLLREPEPEPTDSDLVSVESLPDRLLETFLTWRRRTLQQPELLMVLTGRRVQQLLLSAQRLLVCPGMSMVPEVTVAKHCGLRVLGLTLVTNKVSLDYSREEKVNHDEVLEICKMRAELLQKLVSTLIGRCQQNINTH